MLLTSLNSNLVIISCTLKEILREIYGVINAWIKEKRAGSHPCTVCNSSSCLLISAGTRPLVLSIAEVARCRRTTDWGMMVRFEPWESLWCSVINIVTCADPDWRWLLECLVWGSLACLICSGFRVGTRPSCNVDLHTNMLEPFTIVTEKKTPGHFARLRLRYIFFLGRLVTSKTFAFKSSSIAHDSFQALKD